ncbi:MAG: TA system VapC family ribonuclease toxin [Nocardioidaceae bacterium]
MLTESAGPSWLCDVNVLVALTLSTHVHHRAAHAALREHAGTWQTTPITESALVRLLLNPQVTGRTFPAHEVVAVVRGLRADPRWRWLADESTLVDPVIDMTVLVGHRQVTDLHLVNLAARSGSLLVTFDAGIVAAVAPADRRHIHVLPQ